MDIVKFYQLAALGVDLVKSCAGISRTQLMSHGASAKEARGMLGLYTAYFGLTTFSGKQRKAVAAARANHHNLETLKTIETYTHRAKGATATWNLRLKLCQTRAQDIPGVAKAFLEKGKSKGPAAGVRVTRRAQGNHTLSITASSLDIADYKAALESVNSTNLLEAVKGIFTGQVQAPYAGAAVTTNVNITLNQLDKVLQGDKDVELQLTNGATMTGAQLVARTLAQHGLVTLVHPVQGPINLYRTERYASSKQRNMLSALYPQCVWPNCQKPADECQYHHIDSWKQGGDTNTDNLVPLCHYHNGVNEDEEGPPTRRGKIIKHNGRLGWQPPWGTRVYPI